MQLHLALYRYYPFFLITYTCCRFLLCVTDAIASWVSPTRVTTAMSTAYWWILVKNAPDRSRPTGIWLFWLDRRIIRERKMWIVHQILQLLLTFKFICNDFRFSYVFPFRVLPICRSWQKIRYKICFRCETFAQTVSLTKITVELATSGS